MSMFGTFGSAEGGSPEPQEKEPFDWQEQLKKHGINVPKSPETVEIPENVQQSADHLFVTFCAYMKAGFNGAEALELIKAVLVKAASL
jgi:hypothetical protein